jgi:hypothetical protein
MADSDNPTDPTVTDDVEMGAPEDQEATLEGAQDGDDTIGAIEAEVPEVVSFLEYG